MDCTTPPPRRLGVACHRAGTNSRLPAAFSRYSPEVTMRLIPCSLAVLVLTLLLGGCVGPEPARHNDEGMQEPPPNASPSVRTDGRP
ncbi:hypothetical protein CXP35_05360 [Komagataeibacter xylinus]|nr:hypothetical protein CXP35_05360 [Komagataeibacter xylinus]